MLKKGHIDADKVNMNISSGLARIAFGQNQPATYIWPVYGNKTPVDSVKPVDYQAEHVQQYYKASPEKEKEVIKMSEQQKVTLYNSNAQLSAARSTSSVIRTLNVPL